MKDLDKSKAYDLRGLSKEQRKELLEWLKINDKSWNHVTKADLIGAFLIWDSKYNEWDFDYLEIKNSVQATTLFTNNLEDLGFKPIGEGFYKLDLGNVEISVRNSVFVTDFYDGQIVELFKYDFDKVKKLVELWK